MNGAQNGETPHSGNFNITKLNILSILVPFYEFLVIVDRQCSMFNIYGTNNLTEIILLVIYSFMTFVGVRALKISTCIFTITIVMTFFTKLKTIFLRNVTVESDYIKDHEFLINLLESLKKDKTTSVLVAILISIVIGYFLSFLTNMSSILFCIFMVYKIKENGFFDYFRHNLNLEVSALVFDTTCAFVFFTILYLFTRLIVKIMWGFIFSAYGSMIVTILLQIAIEGRSLDTSDSIPNLFKLEKNSVFIYITVFVISITAQFMKTK